MPRVSSEPSWKEESRTDEPLTRLAERLDQKVEAAGPVVDVAPSRDHRSCAVPHLSRHQRAVHCAARTANFFRTRFDLFDALASSAIIMRTRLTLAVQAMGVGGGIPGPWEPQWCGAVIRARCKRLRGVRPSDQARRTCALAEMERALIGKWKRQIEDVIWASAARTDDHSRRSCRVSDGDPCLEETRPRPPWNVRDFSWRWCGLHSPITLLRGPAGGKQWRCRRASQGVGVAAARFEGELWLSAIQRTQPALLLADWPLGWSGSQSTRYGIDPTRIHSATNQPPPVRPRIPVHFRSSCTSGSEDYATVY